MQRHSHQRQRYIHQTLTRPWYGKPEPGRHVVAHIKLAFLDNCVALAFSKFRKTLAIEGMSKEFGKRKNTVVETIGINLARGVIGIG